MATYNPVSTYTFRDSLAPGDPNKIIKGVYFDAEFGAIRTATLTAEDTSNKNAANGYAGLDSGSRIALAQMFVDGSGNVGYWARSPAEITAGITPTINTYPPLDVRRYGFSEGASASTNTTAITSAIAVANAQTLGGTVYLPAGIFNINSFTVPQYVIIRGAGRFATRLLTASSGSIVLLGGTGGATYGGMGITDCNIIMSSLTATAVTLKGAVGAEVKRMYIEGALTAGRTNYGVVIDGGNASSYFNLIEDINCNHVQNGYKLTTTGSQICTDTTFINCQALGDVHTVGASSIGVYVSAGCGNGSNWIGGNLESCGTGIEIGSNANSVHWYGVRFEDNTKDILIDSLTDVQTFVQCTNLDAAKITNSGGTGYDGSQFIACIDSTGFTFGNRFTGTNKFRGATNTDICLTVEGYPLTTNTLFQIQDSSGTSKTIEVQLSKIGLFGATPVGKPVITGSRGGNAALASLLTKLGDGAGGLGLIQDTTTA